jgi:hypothetical protein
MVLLLLLLGVCVPAWWNGGNPSRGWRRQAVRTRYREARWEASGELTSGEPRRGKAGGRESHRRHAWRGWWSVPTIAVVVVAAAAVVVVVVVVVVSAASTAASVAVAAATSTATASTASSAAYEGFVLFVQDWLGELDTV